MSVPPEITEIQRAEQSVQEILTEKGITISLEAINGFAHGILEDSKKNCETQLQKLEAEVEALKLFVGRSMGDKNTSLSNLLTILLQLRRLSAQVLKEQKGGLEDLLSKGTAGDDIELLKRLQDASAIALSVPKYPVVLRSASVDAITAITAFVSSCITLVKGLQAYDLSSKQKGLQYIAQDNQNCARLVLIEQYNASTSVQTIVKTCSVLLGAAVTISTRAGDQKSGLLEAIIYDSLRIPAWEPRSIEAIEKDRAYTTAIYGSCDTFSKFVSSDAEIDGWSFSRLQEFTVTPKGYEALHKKIVKLLETIKENREALGDTLLSADVETSAGLTQKVVQGEEQVANLVSFAQELWEETYQLPLGFNTMCNALSSAILLVLKVGEGEELRASSTTAATESEPFVILAKRLQGTEEIE
ncbi:hypothetical protein GMRT_13330 [Giardia muris]|uniref:Uncharacterized protein n=1 Tax=Giardia muris TaxID=5742 RepID=A0A4Z1SKV5_GIAMU|nr:hypothetical protein GMRT_13330 [Giardia muris]|eukprot:TNJ26294.1 hypothetical protein GMRT_13330 [Giardia muris]